MPARDDAARRERRRRELLRALLEEEEEQAGPGLTEADLVTLLRELRGPRQRQSALGGLMSPEQLRGFIWGVGAAALLLMVLPTAKQSLRPFAVATLKRGIDLFDQVKSSLGEAGEGLQDLLAEVQFERMKEAAGPGDEAAAAK